MEEHQEHSLGGRVFQRIREDILKGKYKQNDELKEATLGKELGVSRTPVREALRQLELEGLVSIVPNRGAYVNGISKKDIWDIYYMRSTLEGLCARWAVENITEEQIDRLEETILLSEFQMKKGNAFNTEQVTGWTDGFTQFCMRHQAVVCLREFYQISMNMSSRQEKINRVGRTGEKINSGA